MGLHIENSYRPATFHCMAKKEVGQAVSAAEALQRGQRVRTLRKALGLNQEDLAIRIGVDQSTVSDIERGSGFSADVLMSLAANLNTSAELLMLGRDLRTWPFQLVSVDTFLALKPAQRGFVEGRLVDAIEQARQMRADILQIDEGATPPITAERLYALQPEKVKHVSPPHPLKSETSLVEGSALATVVGRLEGKKKRASSKSGAVPKSRVGRRL